MSKIVLINGPNLNLLGQRQPELYGAETLVDIEARLSVDTQALGHELQCFQSNSEGALVDFIQSIRLECAGIIINPAAYSHTSIAILDALNAYDGQVIEVHISDIHAREEFRHHSYVSHRANAVIIGRGVQGYFDALQQLDTML